MEEKGISIVRKKKDFTGLNIAPLVDIIFILLIFFMVTWQFSSDHGIKISLPESETASPGEKDVVIVSINRDREIYLGDEIIEIDSLENKLLLIKKRRNITSLVIRADRKVELEYAVMIFDRVKKAGMDVVTLSTEKEYGKAASDK